MSKPKKIDFNSKLPLGTIEMKRIGWDAPCRHLCLGGAEWKFQRRGADAPVSATYRNLHQQKDWPLGTCRPSLVIELLQWFAGQTDSHGPGDWVTLNGRVIAFLATDKGAT